MQMNTEIPVSCANDQSTSEISATITNSNGEDENSVIMWYQNDNDDNFSQLNMNNNEDFIEIDIFPEWPEQEESHETSTRNSPQNITVDDANISYNTFLQDSDKNFDPPPTPPEIKNAKCLKNLQEILTSHRNASSDDGTRNNEERQKLFDSKLKYAISFGNSVNISCYIEGLVSILQIFNRIDCYMEKFAQMTNDCRCTPSVRRGEVTLSHYLLEASGATCENCSMDIIIDKLNLIFLKNVARAQFVPVQQIIGDSHRLDTVVEKSVGATNGGLRCSGRDGATMPLESGWLRKWLGRHLGDGVLVGIVYNDVHSDHLHSCRPCNKVRFRLVTGYSDEEFHLTIPVESVRDEIIENCLLQEESIKVLKSNILKCRHHHDDFERILKQTDNRFNEMNVLGQIIGTFREKSSDSFRGFVPEEVHHIKIPNMHRNGVMLVVNI